MTKLAPSLRRSSVNTQPFQDDDQGYLKWVADHPEGYVLNIQRGLNPSDARLHRATCHTITRVGGGPWTGQYIKVCSAMLGALEDWAQAKIQTDIPGCGFCHPHDD